MQAFEMQPNGLRLLRLVQVEPLLPVLPDVLYEFTIPQLTNRALTALRRRSVGRMPVYAGNTGSGGESRSLEEQYLELLEAARLISGMYSHCLEPLRFAGTNGSRPDRDDIFNGFVRTLVGSRVLASVELVAAKIQVLRSLDDYQAGIGSNTARWMQYLASEALQTTVVQRGFTTNRDVKRLGKALHVIRESTTILDRFKALGRASHEGSG